MEQILFIKITHKNHTVKKLFRYNTDIPLHLGTLSRQNALLCLSMKSRLDGLLVNSAYTNQEKDMNKHDFINERIQIHKYTNTEDTKNRENTENTKETKNSENTNNTANRKNTRNLESVELIEYSNQNHTRDNTKHYHSPLTLILAVSGGIDSISMLAMFIALQKKYPINLHIAHFNHGIRAESVNETILVENIAHTFNITFHHEETDVPHFAQISHMGLEEAARLKRYDFLEKVRNNVHADYICTAHHAEDLAEDVLMRLCRGAAWPALGGMQEICNNRKILRPLLKETKKELIRFVDELNLPFAIDKSNEDQLFLRNRVRKTIFPLFLSENPSFLDSIKHLHNCAQRDSIFFQEHINNFWKTVETKDGSIIIQLEKLKNIQEAIRFRVYIHALSLLGKGYTQHETLEKLDSAVMQNKGNSIFKFTKEARAKIFQNTLVFY